MIIKAGDIVSHMGGPEWGVGKVLNVTTAMASIHFSDGKNRKIASSHYSCLLPATKDSYVAPAEPALVVPAPPSSRQSRKKK